MPSPASTRRLGRRGTTSLEFALTGAIIMAFLVGAADFCRYMVTLSSVRVASAEAARMVTLAGSANLNAGRAACQGLSGTLANTTTRVRFLSAASVRASMSGCQTNLLGVTTVTITLTYPFSFLLNVFGAQQRDITEVSTALFN
jgi:hypothetical protein